MSYFIPVLSGILLAIGVLWMKNPFFKLAKRSVALLNILVSDMDEDEKFEAVNGQVFQTLGSVLIVVLMAVFVVAVSVSVLNYAPELLDFEPLSGGWSMGLLAVGSIIPFVVPTGKKNASAYSDMAQLFHHIVLDNYHLGKRLLERQIKDVKAESTREGTSRVLITGLARAGTTALTKELEKRGDFASLDYSNMPVLLAPRLWARIYKPKRVEDQERAHGDGVKVGLASVEALEEYFFKVIKNDSFILENGIAKHELSEEENALYRRYQNSIAEDKVYLAKNNNAATRLPSLIKHNPDLSVFVLLRDPVQHAFSLMKQHQKFEKEQQDDPFIRSYMDWLGHHEFGGGQRPFLLNDGDEKLFEGDTNDINYWLDRWISYYTFITDMKGVHFVSYEGYVNEPHKTLEVVAETAGVSLSLEGLEAFSKRDAEVSGVNPELKEKALAIQTNLYKLCLNQY